MNYKYVILLGLLLATIVLGILNFRHLQINPKVVVEPVKLPTIEVFIPNYKNVEYLQLGYQLLKKRQNPNPVAIVAYTILTQEEDPADRKKVIDLFSQEQHTRVIELPQPGLAGGSSLMQIFKAVNVLGFNADIAVTCDTDAFILASNWDSRLVEVFSDPDVMVAAINPRPREFAGYAEWNWMAFRTDFYRAPILTWMKLEYHDWGHWFTKVALNAGKKQHLWDISFLPIKGKSPTVCGDELDKLWVLHFFYKSRVHNEKMVNKTAPYMVTDEETTALLKWISSDQVQKGFGNISNWL